MTNRAGLRMPGINTPFLSLSPIPPYLLSSLAWIKCHSVDGDREIFVHTDNKKLYTLKCIDPSIMWKGTVKANLIAKAKLSFSYMERILFYSCFCAKREQTSRKDITLYSWRIGRTTKTGFLHVSWGCFLCVLLADLYHVRRDYECVDSGVCWIRC